MNVRPALRRVVVLTALATVWPLAACGGGGNLESWVGTFCGSGSGVRSALSDANEALRAQLKIEGLSPVDLKASVVRSAKSYVDASGQAVTRIQGEGEPSVDDGQEIQAKAVETFAEIDAQVKALQVEATALPASTAAELADALGPYSQHVADESRAVAGSFQRLSPYQGFSELEKVSRTPNDTDLPGTCGRLQTVAS